MCWDWEPSTRIVTYVQLCPFPVDHETHNPRSGAPVCRHPVESFWLGGELWPWDLLWWQPSQPARSYCRPAGTPNLPFASCQDWLGLPSVSNSNYNYILSPKSTEIEKVRILLMTKRLENPQFNQTLSVFTSSWDRLESGWTPPDRSG